MARPCSETLFGVRFDALSLDDAVARVSLDIAAGHRIRLAFTNPEFVLAIRNNEWLARYLNGCTYNFADGIGLVWASRLVGKGLLTERVTGTDFFPALLTAAKARGELRLALYGAREPVMRRAVTRIRREYPWVRIVFARHGYGDHARAAEALSNEAGDVLMVCLGNPAQEAWIIEHADALAGFTCVFGNGGCLDFFSEAVPRAPVWMRERGLEWLYRLTHDFSYGRLKRQLKLLRFPIQLLFVGRGTT